MSLLSIMIFSGIVTMAIGLAIAYAVHQNMERQKKIALVQGNLHSPANAENNQNHRRLAISDKLRK